MGQMMSNSKDQDAELDKLVAEMNSASTDKKLDAIAAVLTKLVEQRKAMHEQMQKMMSANDKEGMGMCRMMRTGRRPRCRTLTSPLTERFSNSDTLEKTVSPERKADLESRSEIRVFGQGSPRFVQASKTTIKVE